MEWFPPPARPSPGLSFPQGFPPGFPPDPPDGPGGAQLAVAATDRPALLWAFAAFLLAFAGARLVTRMIRAGRGPFRNVSGGGLHIHHAVPGVVLMTIGGFGAVAAGDDGWPAIVCAVVFGVGAGLVLDEFALILHLADVYWSDEGRRSVEVVALTAAAVGLILAGYLPLGVENLTEEQLRNGWAVTGTVLFHFVCALVALVKGKPWMAVVGVLVPFVALVGAVRLARPTSPWARRYYRGRRARAMTRARRRAERHDRRWDPVGRRISDLLGGAPDPEASARGGAGAPGGPAGGASGRGT
ncbi:hypothetical protein GCM10027160_50640 [Streptomyces calidiresistens]|uniref:hypothetical protein n=1 Tax=Streptomyces calidiresistens TaxID=1485586 RepID=UPI001E3ED3A3|nr:hypothetical protein [Streptomyces calidiresistens]